MARRTKVASLKKRRKSRPLAVVDKKGNVKDFGPGKKSKILQKNVVSKALLKKRKKKGKKGGILLFVKGKSVYSVPRKSGGKRKRKRKSRKARIRKLRKSRSRKGSRRCPKTRRGGGFASASRCIARGKGKTLASKKVYNKAVF